MYFKLLVFALLPALFLMGGCSARSAREAADIEVNRIIDQKYKNIPGETLPGKAVRDAEDASSGKEDAVPLNLSLEEAVSLSMENNRAYKSRREDVYLNILDLTYERYLFGFRWGVSGDAGWSRSVEGEETLSGGLNARFFRMLATGADVTFDVKQDFLRYLTGDRDKDLQTIIGLNILQPLLRGAGSGLALEGLVQAERDAVYAIRAFLRYQKDFYVDITENYLNLLLFRNREKNYKNNYESLRRTRERIELLAEAGRLPAIQVGQARQNELAAYQRWVNSVNSYESALDDFKIQLAIVPEKEIVLDDTLLEKLIVQGIEETDINLEEFTESALKKRLDLITQYNRVEDARRKAAAAKDRMRTGLDLTIGAGIQTEKENSLRFDFVDSYLRAGVALDFPADRFPERNQYIKALISLKRAEREFKDKLDTVRLEITRQHRNLEGAYRSYVIQKNSLDLARQRIESTGMLLEAGRATTRDLLEAEESFISAQNDLASEIINHKAAYLRFLYSTECLEVDEEGLWRDDIYETGVKEGSN
jgi:outer membrane protein TolC